MTSTGTRPARTDPAEARLRDAVLAELAWVPSVDATHLGVAVHGGAVTLTGEVDTYAQRLAAERAVLRVHGVTALAQEVVVRAVRGMSDTDLARAAGEAVDRAVDVPDTVTVTVHDHVVTLGGTVEWQFERVAAGRSVRTLRGVRGLADTILVVPGVLAAGVSAAVDAALHRSARVAAEHVTVSEGTAGMVTLSGTVGSWAERDQAEHTSWSAPGVTHVANHLLIEYPPQDTVG